jgi:hypothetical protein
MTLNEVVWRQTCAIKTKSDEFLKSLQAESHTPAIAYEIAAQTAIVVCYASYATGDISPIEIYDDIIEQVGQLQTAIWQIQKNCEVPTVQDAARKLYESCATLKKRLRKKLAVLSSLEAITESAIHDTQNALDVTYPSHRAVMYT